MCNRTAERVTKDAGDDVPGRLNLGMAASAMMDDGIELFRLKLDAAAALAGSKLRNQCFKSGETSPLVRIAGTLRSTWTGASPRHDRIYKMTSSRVLG